jgi:protein involved in polysaccharide export with SLBB domain
MKSETAWNSRPALILVCLALVLCALSAGCSHQPPPLDPIVSTPSRQTDVTLTPGDSVDIKFFYVPELNESQTIRPDGKLTMQLVGEVQAAGKTPDQLRQSLFDMYTPQLKKPDVAVIVRGFQGRRIFVGGEVLSPGVLPMPGPMTAIEAIMQAGGFNAKAAKIKAVILIRHKDGKRYGAELNFKDALKAREYEEFELEPMDIIYVPQKTVVKVNTWIDQHISKMIPYMGISYSFPVNGNTMTLDTTKRYNVE